MGVDVPSLVPEADPETRSDKATLELIRGRGFILTFSSHFLVAVIVGVLGWMYAQQKGQASGNVEQDIHELQREVAALRSDFEFAKATRDLSDKETERKLNELLARTAK